MRSASALGEMRQGNRRRRAAAGRCGPGPRPRRARARPPGPGAAGGGPGRGHSRVGVLRVIPGLEAQGGAGGPGLGPADPQQRAQAAAAALGHPGQRAGAGAARQAEQHGLGLVVRVWPEQDRRRAGGVGDAVAAPGTWPPGRPPPGRAPDRGHGDADAPHRVEAHPGEGLGHPPGLLGRPVLQPVVDGDAAARAARAWAPRRPAPRPGPASPRRPSRRPAPGHPGPGRPGQAAAHAQADLRRPRGGGPSGSLRLSRSARGGTAAVRLRGRRCRRDPVQPGAAGW